MSKLVKVLIAMTTCAFLFVGCGSKEEEAPKNDTTVEQQEANTETPEEKPEEEVEENTENQTENQTEEKPVEEVEEFVLLDKPGLNKEIEKMNTALREQLQPQYDNEDMNVKLEAASIEMQAWDSLLGKIYQNIQMTKSQEEIATIMEEQVEWLTQRDASVEEETSAIEDELEKSAKRLDILITKTREKCAEVVDKYILDTAELEEFKNNKESGSSEDKNGTGETVTEEVTEEGTEGTTEEVTEDTTEGTTEEGTEGTTEEGTEDTTEEGTEGTTEEGTEDTTEEVTE